MIAMPNPRLPWYAWPAVALFAIGAFLYLLVLGIIAALCWLGNVIGEGIARATWRGDRHV